MTAYNPIEAMQRMQAAGVTRKLAESLANELTSARDDLVTKADLQTALDAALAKQTLRICSVLGGLVAFGFTAIGVLISLNH